MTSSVIFSDSQSYQSWRQRKLEGYDPKHNNSPINIADPFKLEDDEIVRIADQIKRRNFAVYRLDPESSDTPQAIMALCRQLGLTTSIGNPESGQNHISHIYDRASESKHRSRYIPYTSHALNWHTDGYYCPDARKVRSFVLHCVRPAQSGGENGLLDHEMLCLEMMNHDQHLVESLCQADAFSIPENIVNEQVVREAFRGPVFSIDSNGLLYMRFTQRNRHIVWKQTPQVAEAVALINSILESPIPWKTTITLAEGEGILCNNIVHCRHAYSDSYVHSGGRLLYRIRFMERLSGESP